MKNEYINIPEVLVGEKSSIFKEFRELALKEGNTEDFAITLEKLLPSELRTTPVWFDKLTKMRRYYYGPPIDDLQTDFVWGGTANNLPVTNLYTGLKLANQILTKEQLVNYVNRLKDPSKHIDTLFEMRPVMNIGRFSKKYF